MIGLIKSKSLTLSLKLKARTETEIARFKPLYPVFQFHDMGKDFTSYLILAHNKIHRVIKDKNDFARVTDLKPTKLENWNSTRNFQRRIKYKSTLNSSTL